MARFAGKSQAREKEREEGRRHDGASVSPAARKGNARTWIAARGMPVEEGEKEGRSEGGRTERTRMSKGEKTTRPKTTVRASSRSCRQAGVTTAQFVHSACGTVGRL